jgi:ribosome-binding protein aMBF1 (putative translation factor)
MKLTAAKKKSLPTTGRLRLGLVVKDHRMARELSVRGLAKELGIAPSTLLRVEEGKALDGDSLLRVLLWLLS